MDSKKRKLSPAAMVLNLGGVHPNPDILRNRFADRDARIAADTRTEIEKMMGDPPMSQSALAQNNGAKPKSDQRF